MLHLQRFRDVSVAPGVNCSVVHIFSGQKLNMGHFAYR